MGAAREGEGTAGKTAGRGVTVAEIVRAYQPAKIKQGEAGCKDNVAAVKALVTVAGGKRVCNLDVLDVYAVMDQWANKAYATRYGRRICFRRLLVWLNENWGAPKLKDEVPKMSPPSPRNVTASADEKDRIIDAAPKDLRCWILLCSDLAIRSGTAAILAPKHYDAGAGTLTFKTKKERQMCLPVTEELAELLRPLAHLEAEKPFVCHLSRLGRMSANHLRRRFRELLKLVGIDKRIIPHDLRRTTAVHVYEGTGDLRIVQAILGHRHMRSTFHYLDHRNTPVMLSTLEQAKRNPSTGVIQ